MKRLVTRSVARLRKEEVDELAACTMRNRGQMWSTLTSFYDKKEGKAVILRDDDGTVASWALIYRYDEEDRWSAQFYTKKPYRRKGLGSKIAGSVKRQFGRVHVYPWDHASEEFFFSNELDT